jgi:hypothetical protein
VLVFKGNTGTYIAKVTDFGYSSLHAGDDGLIEMPISRPWNPPEHDGTRWLWHLAEAEKMDIFSLSMLWLWILFERSLACSETLPREILDRPSNSSVIGILHHFKINNKLFPFAELMLAREPNLDSTEKADLTEFFSLGLNPHQDGRDIGKSKFSDRLLLSR